MIFNAFNDVNTNIESNQLHLLEEKKKMNQQDKDWFINDMTEFNEAVMRGDFIIKTVDTKIDEMDSIMHGELPEVVCVAKAKTRHDTLNSSDVVNVKICKYIARIRRFKKVFEFIQKGIDLISQVFYWCLNNIKDNMAKWLLCRSQTIILKLKKMTINLKILVMQAFRGIIKGLSAMKGNWLETALNVTINALITSVNAICTAASAVCGVIDTLLKSLPNLMSIGAEQVCFFATPKSMAKVICPIFNANDSCTDRLSDAVKNVINKIEIGEKYTFKALKYATVAAGAAAGAASVFTDFEIPESICDMIKDFDNSKVVKKINDILAKLLEAYPLPKYEELTPKTLGYLNWLMTGFIPAGHKSFGIPLFP